MAETKDKLITAESLKYVHDSLSEKIVNIQAQGSQSTTLFADSIEWLNENGDTTKPYVLPDGYIYAYTGKKVPTIHNANDGTAFINTRPSGSTNSSKDANTTKNGLFTTAPISIDKNWSSCIVNISGLEKLVPAFYASLYVYYFDTNGTFIAYNANNQIYKNDSSELLTSSAEEEITLPISIDVARANANRANYFANAAYIRITLGIKLNSAITSADVENLVINFEKLNSEGDITYGWYSTGVSYTTDDYSQAIANLQTDMETLKEAVQASPSASGAIWYAIGDSITYGLYSTSATEYSQPIIGQRWVDYVAKYNGYKLTNLGVSGSGFVTGTTFRTIVDRNDFSGVDLVTIMLGINDWKNENAVNLVGTVDDDISIGGTIVSELRYGIERIISQNPYCKIILITPINAKIGSRGTEASNWAYGYTGSITPCGSLKNFNDKLKEVCEYYGIQVIDVTNNSVVNRKNITTVLPDGIHPNLDCYKALGLELARKITYA
ncbi:MAG: SGNH/GDSL hydrolase family protein [Clostridia bacterium]|nr:SGNH/GDSL hydrolase family protein [Clostridia bacterium]